ncbi:hypothetical protein [Pseudoruegeria sp. HB172150]|uniref:hypothetical protein n=1 Tax=Pseudoruegeria sp. HB172150 TaxID=2721164 RepID=UPI001551D17A|nr:hypothetical protein [Pseudoruegeria sp. HB172150]
MTKRLIATVVAAAVAMSAFAAAPARALDSGELGRLLLGTGAVIVIGSAIANNNKNHNNRNKGLVVNRNKPHYTYRPAPNRGRNALVVPQQCLRGHGNKLWVDQHCLNRYRY